MTEYTKSIVWITGGSKGIGKALVTRYLNDGYTVIASSRSISWNDFSTQEKDSKRLFLEPGDLSVKSDNQRIIKNILKTHGQIDIAILNAGTCEYLDINHFSSDPFKRLLSSNVMSTVFALEVLLPHLLNTKASLAVTGSVISYGGLPQSAAYGASKAAIEHLVQSLQVEAKPYPLHISLISPGFVKTPLTDKNTFPMPCIISAEKAASIIKKGIEKKRYHIHFPLRFSLYLKCIMSLPHSWMTSLISHTLPKKKEP